MSYLCRPGVAYLVDKDVDIWSSRCRISLSTKCAISLSTKCAYLCDQVSRHLCRQSVAYLCRSKCRYLCRPSVHLCRSKCRISLCQRYTIWTTRYTISGHKDVVYLVTRFSADIWMTKICISLSQSVAIFVDPGVAYLVDQVSHICIQVCYTLTTRCTISLSTKVVYLVDPGVHIFVDKVSHTFDDKVYDIFVDQSVVYFVIQVCRYLCHQVSISLSSRCQRYQHPGVVYLCHQV